MTTGLTMKQLEEIRARHEADQKDTRFERYANQAHTDRASLLAEVERLRKVLLLVRSCANKNAVPGQPKTKLHAFGRISGRITEALNGAAQ